jgi:hypothetical protein
MGKCDTTCTIFYIIFLTYLFMFGVAMVYSGDLKKLDDILDEKQRAVHEKIKKERLHHFYAGLGVGGILGLFILISNIKMTSKHCLAGLVLLLSIAVVYGILPKSDHIINHLDTPEKKQLWLNVKRNFVKKTVISFVLAIVTYFSMLMFFK